MKQIYNFLKKYSYLNNFESFINQLYNQKEVKGMFLCGSRAKNTFNQKKELSDFDFFIITSKKVSKIQSLHYHIQYNRIELMMYEEKKFCNPSFYDKTLLNKLLNKAELIFSKNNKIKEYFFNFSKSKLKKGISISELDSMWFKIIWNILKVKSYEKKDIELSKILAMQNYFFIGLLYGRLCGEQIYNFSESIKYMRKKHPSFWRKYKEILNKNNKIIEIENLISFLPHSKIYLTKKSLIELNNFISPLTVMGEEDKTIIQYKRNLDKILIPTLSFLNKSLVTFNYYALEGLGGTGKTNFLKMISSKRFAKFEEISKNNNLARDIKKFSMNTKINRKANKFFLKNELTRMKNFSKQKINILDRSIYSQIVYNYANFKAYKQNGIFYLIRELKKLEKENFRYPKMIYLRGDVNYSIKILSEKKKEDMKDKTNNKLFIKYAMECYDLLNILLGANNSLEIQIPSERKILFQKFEKFINKTHFLKNNFSIKKIEKYLKK